MLDHELPVGGPGGRMFDNHFTTNEGYPDWLTTNPKIVEETEQAKARCRKEKELFYKEDDVYEDTRNSPNVQ